MAAKLISQDSYYEYYLDYFHNIGVKFRKNKFNEEIQIMLSDEIAQKIFGFASLDDMLNDSKIQSIINKYHKQTKKSLFIPFVSLNTFTN